MPLSTTNNITNLQEKVIGPARMTLKDDVLAIKSSYEVVSGTPGMDDTYNSPKLPGVTAFGLSEGVDMVSETLVDSNVSISATEVGVTVELTNKMLRTVRRDEFLRNAGTAMGSAINVKQEQDYASLIDGYGTVVGLDGASATIGQLGAALAQLRNASEPLPESMFDGVSAVISPFGWHDISAQLFPTGSGTSHAPDTAQVNRANTGVLENYWPVGDYFGTPIKLSTNLVASGSNIRAGVFHRKSGLIYEFMPVEMDIDDSDKSMRSLELVMVVDYGFGEILDPHGREWDYDNTAPTS
jgi:hypothetical protein